MNLFSDTDQTPEIDPNKDYFAELVGEDKKYKDNQAAGRAIVEKDAFIERLKFEQAELRKELQTRLKLEEAVEKLQAKQTPPSSERQPEAPEPGTEKPATPEDIKKLVADVLQEANSKSQRQKNIEAVERSLQEAFGPTYKRTVTEQAKKLGLGEEFLSNLAAEQPAAFLKLLDVQARQEAPSTAVTAPRSSVNSDAMPFRPNDGIKRQSFYDKMRKADPKRYWSVSVQNEIHREALRQGESFFD